MYASLRHFTVPGSDQALVAIVDEPAGGNPIHGCVVLCAAFGASANSMFPFAHALVANGYQVIRIDFRNHVGLSGGDMLSAGLSSMKADIDAVMAEYPDAALAAVSLSARPALRSLASTPRARAGILVTPMVHTRATVHAVTEHDFLGMPLDEVPGTFKVLGYDVGKPFVADCHENGYETVEDAIADAVRVPVPLRFIAGNADPWVTHEHVRTVRDAVGESATLATVEAASHRLNRNPVVAELYIAAMLAELFALDGRDDQPVLPTHDDKIRTMSKSKERRRALRDSVAQPPYQREDSVA